MIKLSDVKIRPQYRTWVRHRLIGSQPNGPPLQKAPRREALIGMRLPAPPRNAKGAGPRDYPSVDPLSIHPSFKSARLAPAWKEGSTYRPDPMAVRPVLPLGCTARHS